MSENKYLRWTTSTDSYKKYSFPTVSISYNATNSDSSTTIYGYEIKNAQKLLDSAISDYLYTEIECNLIQDILTKRSILKTPIPQRVEDALVEFVSELDRDFVEDMGDSLDSYLRDKSYDIAERILDEELEDEYKLGTDRNALIEVLATSIDFSACYEIIGDIRHAPRTFEEHLRDIGMSIYDFL